MYKRIGSLDFSTGHMKYFVTYCATCHNKILLDRIESEILLRKRFSMTNHFFGLLENIIYNFPRFKIQIVKNEAKNNSYPQATHDLRI